MILKTTLVMVWLTHSGYSEVFPLRNYINPVRCEMERIHFERSPVMTMGLMYNAHIKHVYLYCHRGLRGREASAGVLL